MSSDIILEGETSVFKRVDLDAWGSTYNLVPFDSDLKSMGFSLVGDMLCSAMAHSVTRHYVNETDRASVMLLVSYKNSELNVIGMFIDSVFANGVNVTTSTTTALADRTTGKFLRKAHAWKGAYDLYQQHKTFLSELSEINGELQTMEANLLFLAKAIDSATVQFNSIS